MSSIKAKNLAHSAPAGLRKYLAGRPYRMPHQGHHPVIVHCVLYGTFAWSESWNGVGSAFTIQELAEKIMELITCRGGPDCLDK